MTMREEFERAAQLRNVSREAAENFLLIELNTSLTFARAAVSEPDDTAKRERNRANARKGYDTLLRFSKKFSVPPPDAQDFAEGLQGLKRALITLGETDLD